MIKGNGVFLTNASLPSISIISQKNGQNGQLLFFCNKS